MPPRFVALAFAATIGLSAALLFQLEFILGKQLLPWFGGAPSVWTTCMLYYQVALLAGYGYAHLVIERLPPPKQRLVHLGLIALAALVLSLRAGVWPSPMTPSEVWKPTPGDPPVLGILALLAVTTAVPFVLLASTGPLLQAWYARVSGGKAPWYLYGLSNLGSVVGLVTYPLLVEPRLGVTAQGWAWSAVFVAFALGAGFTALLAGRPEPTPVDAPDPHSDTDEPAAAPPTQATRGLWLALATNASVMLLAITAVMSQEVAVIPLLWMIPLALYLLSFVLCFQFPGSYRRAIWHPAVVLSLAGATVILFVGVHVPAVVQMLAWSAILFSICMVCHGELYRMRPPTTHLTGFYLVVSIGGALGGLLTAVVAPLLFVGLWELNLGLIATGVLVVAVLRRDPDSWLARRGPMARLRRGAASLGAGTLVVALVIQAGADHVDSIHFDRSFFGILRVDREHDPQQVRSYLALKHGRITHGYQFEDPALRREVTSYYGPTSGAGLALLHHRARAHRGLRVGVVGLGTGSLAAYAQLGDHWRFYEIDPSVVALSRGEPPLFTYLADAPTEIDIVVGDARRAMETEPANEYDVLLLDAFSSDAIPMHLLTREATGVYLSHLAEHGILAVHVSNRFLDLDPVVEDLARHHGLIAFKIADDGDKDALLYYSDWILLARTPEALDNPEILAGAAVLDPARTVAWTDDFGDLLSVLD